MESLRNECNWSDVTTSCSAHLRRRGGALPFTARSVRSARALAFTVSACVWGIGALPALSLMWPRVWLPGVLFVHVPLASCSPVTGSFMPDTPSHPPEQKARCCCGGFSWVWLTSVVSWLEVKEVAPGIQVGVA